jgi:hypothetical protein
MVNEATVGPATRTYRVTGLNNGERYVFRVRARNARGLSPPSNVVAAYPRSPLPSAPRSSPWPHIVDLDVVALSSAVTIRWTEPIDSGASAISRYVVQRSMDGVSWISIASVAPATNVVAQSYQDTGRPLNTVHRYRVAAANASGHGPWATAIVLRTPTPCPDRSITGHDGEILVTRAFHYASSCAHASAQQHRIANKEMTWNPDGGWGTPVGTVMESCRHDAFSSTESETPSATRVSLTT